MQSVSYQFFYSLKVEALGRLAFLALSAAWLFSGNARAAGVAVSLGGSVTLTAAAEGAQPFSYQWSKDGVALSNSNSPTLTLSNAQASVVGSYTVVISNAVGSAQSDAVQVTLGSSGTTGTSTSTGPAAPMLSDPDHTTVAVGGNATFSVSVTGSPAPAVHWERSTDGGSTFVSLTDGSDFTGTQTATLTVIGATAAQNGWMFLCKAVNSVNAAASNPARLTVSAFAAGSAGATAPVVSDPQAATVAAGNSATFSVTVTGSPAPAVHWEVSTNGGSSFAAITDGSQYRGTQTGTLTVLAPTTAQSGWMFLCKAVNSVNAAASNSARLTVTAGASSGVAVRAAVRSDLNGDGSPDIFWQNTAKGDRATWLMKGSTATSAIGLGIVPVAWRIAGAADFNQDGKADILWENTATGEHGIWLMNGTVGTSAVGVGTIDTAWRVAGVVDYDRDGNVDILWENRQTGDHAAWLMKGTTAVGSIRLPNTPTTWRLVTAADFNADGQADLVLENATTGEHQIWLMNGTSVAQKVDIGTLETYWRLVAAEDYDGDGQTDLLWQNTVRGNCGIWLMKGTTYSGWSDLGMVPTEWSIAN